MAKGTLKISGADSFTAADLAPDSVGSSEIAANAVGSAEIAEDAVLPAKIAYLGDGSGKLSGTITGQQLRLGTAFTLTDDLTVNGDVTLGKIRDDGTGQSLTQDSSANRTITGTGTLRMGHATEKTSISGLTGVLDPVVTGQHLAKAWVNFNGTGTVAIRDSYNVTSITDQTTGDYIVNFASAMPTANYCMQLSCGGAAVIMIGGRGDFATSQTTTTCRIGTRSSTSSQNWFDEELVNVVIFGD